MGRGQPESQALLINSDPVGGGGDAHEDLHGAGGMLKAGGPAAAVYTLCAMSLGVGVFVLPIVFKDLGTVSGALGIVFFALWGYWMQVVLIEVAESYAPRIFSYEDLVERTLGKFGKLILALFMAVTCLLGNAAHMKTVVMLLHDLLEWYITGTYGNVELSTTKELILYVGLLSVAFVFSTGDKMSALRHVSSISVTVVLLTCAWCTGECIFWYMLHEKKSEFRPLLPNNPAHSNPNGTILYSTDWKSYAADLPAIAFAFSGTFCLFPVYREIHDKSLPNMKKVIGRSTFICAAGYMIVSLFGIWTFGKDIDVNPTTGKPASNYLYVFPPDHYVVTLLCFGLCITITLLYAVINFPFLASMEKLMDFLPGVTRDTVWHKGQWFRTIATLCGMVVIVIVNIQFKNLLSLFGFCGGWGISFVVYFIPSLVALSASRRPLKRPLWYQMVLVLSAFAVLVMAGGFTYATFNPPNATHTNHTAQIEFAGDFVNTFGPK